RVALLEAQLAESTEPRRKRTHVRVNQKGRFASARGRRILEGRPDRRRQAVGPPRAPRNLDREVIGGVKNPGRVDDAIPARLPQRKTELLVEVRHVRIGDVVRVSHATCHFSQVGQARRAQPHADRFTRRHTFALDAHTALPETRSLRHHDFLESHTDSFTNAESVRRIYRGDASAGHQPWVSRKLRKAGVSSETAGKYSPLGSRSHQSPVCRCSSRVVNRYS